MATHGRTNLRLHLGSGDHLLPGWINIDLHEEGVDAQIDLREEWPFANNSVAYIFSEHTLEHFDFPQDVRHFLAETMRVLAPGGTVEIGVPDTSWPMAAYRNQTDDYWRVCHSWIPPNIICDTQMDIINYHFRLDGEHRYAWDEETLTKELKRAGFTGIDRLEFNPSLHSEARRHGTLYMRARKPT